VLGAGSQPTTGSDPVETVREAYRLEKASLQGAGPSPLSESERGKLFSHGFVTLWAQDEKFMRTTGDIGNVVGDYDVLLNAQDYDETTLSDLRLTLTKRTPSRAEVHASFHVFAHEPVQEVRFDLVVQGGRWVIDDIRSNGHSVRKALSRPRPCVEGLDLPCEKAKVR